MTNEIGPESRKTFELKLRSGFFERYMQGNGAEIGVGPWTPILPFCVGYDIGTPGYDGLHIPVVDCHYDYLYSSHCLEHVQDPYETIQEWFRVIKPQGFMIIVVPHRDLYEKRLELPSLFSLEHKRFYTPSQLLCAIESPLVRNSYRIRHLQDNDEGYDYFAPDTVHAIGQYEIEVVIQKL